MSFDYNPDMSGESAIGPAWKSFAAKAALTGAIAGVGAMFLGVDNRVSVLGFDLPGSVAIGVGCAAGSVTGDLAHQYLVPMIPQDQKFAAIENAAIGVGGAIAGAYGAMSLMGDVSFQSALVLGGGSYLAGDYVTHNVLEKGFIY